MNTLSLPYELLKRERPLVARFVAASLLRGVLASVWILLVRAFLSGVVSEHAGLTGRLAAAYGTTAALWIVAAVLGLVHIAAALLAYDARLSEQRIASVVELGAMDLVTRHMLGLSLGFFDRTTHGELLENLRTDVLNLRISTVAAASVAIEVTQGVGLIAAAFWVSPSLAFWAFVIMPAAIAPFAIAARPVVVGAFGARKASVVLFNRMLQVLQGIRLVKVYARETAEADRAFEQAENHLRQFFRMERIRAAARVALDAFGGLSLIIAIVAGGLQVMDGRISWPGFLAFLMAARAVQGPLSNIGVAYLEIRRQTASVNGIQALLRERPEIQDRPGARPLAAPVARVALDDVTYTVDGLTILENVTADIGAGETLGVVGPSAAGKSTVINLLARCYDPTAGAIRISGIDARDVRLADVRRAVALVPQDPFLFAASIGDNILCGRPGASPAAVETAARAAGIHEEIVSMALGYDTLVGHGGRPLSRGEAQRINIARAFLKDAPILLLDEPTSSLDAEAEVRVQHAIDRLMAGRISVVVAHRLKTVRNATRILVLDGGRVAGFGTHAELLRNCDLYRRLSAAQVTDDLVQV